jgi:HEAT repeat protein
MPRQTTPKPIEAYLPDLTSPDPRARREAVKGLRQSGNPQAFPHLLAALQDPTVGVLIHAIRGLEALGDPRAIPHLINRLDRASCDVCDEVGEALVSFGEQAIPALMEALSHPHARVRAIAVACLRQLRHAPALEAITKLLTDPDPSVIRAVLLALWAMRDPRAGDALAAFIAQPPASLDGQDPYPWQREAAFALAEWGDPRAVPVLARSINRADDRRCIDVIRQLGKVGTPAVRPLIEAYITLDPESTCASQARATLDQL